MFAALVAVFAAQAGGVIAQDVTSSDDIPAAGAQTAAAYYEAATGNLYLSVGSGLISVGLQDSGGGLEFSNANSSTTLGVPLGPTDEAVVYLNFTGGTLGEGVFNVGQLLASNNNIVTGADFSGAFPTVTLLFQRQGEQPELNQSINVIASGVLLGDVNLDGNVDFLDISPFIAVLSGGTFQAEADCDENGDVDFLDITPFIALLTGSGS
jgi:hypothetical protein